MSTTHTLFYISTSWLEFENEVLQEYVLRLPLQRQVQDIILAYFEPTSTLTSRKSIDPCISGKLNGEIIDGFFIFLEWSFSYINCPPTQWYLDLDRKRSSEEEAMSKPLYISFNENENYWILAIAFPKAELVVSYDTLMTKFKEKKLQK